jgi:RNA polymerase sigma-70 factor (ECF subfamily)
VTEATGFSETFARACQGDESALRELLEKYGDYLRRVIRHRLDERLRSRFDSLDFVQMVWASFFAEPNPLARFSSPEQMIRYLAGMARNKLIDQQRRRLAGKRAACETPLDETAPDAPRSNETPSQCAIARERLQILQKLACERDREIMRLRLMGLSYREIAERCEMNERTVRKIIERLTKR